MRWFFALNRACPVLEPYAQLIKAAVLSAHEHTRLEPVFLWDGPENDLTRWLAQRGVTMVWRACSLAAELEAMSRATGNPDYVRLGTGAFARIDIPNLCRERGWSDERVLYTDCDVLFTGDPEPLLPDLGASFFALAPEEDRTNFETANTGVMLMNVPALQSMSSVFRRFAAEHLRELSAYGWDQKAYLAFFRHGWEKLPLQLNWKPYWGWNEDSRIVHFHGPKPFDRLTVAEGRADPRHAALARGAFERYAEVWQQTLARA